MAKSKAVDAGSTKTTGRKRYSTQRPDSERPLFNAAAVHEQLQKYDRTPFIDLMVEWLRAAPSPEAIAAFAERAPGLYINALAALGRLSGFTEKTETLINLNVIDPRKLSDADLEDRLFAMQDQLRLPPMTIDAVALPVGVGKHEPTKK